MVVIVVATNTALHLGFVSADDMVDSKLNFLRSFPRKVIKISLLPLHGVVNERLHPKNFYEIFNKSFFRASPILLAFNSN